MQPYQHNEAFCLMQYQSDDSSETEIIWNSRDGVTPFVIHLRSGKEARHVRWSEDHCDPDFKPPLGMRIFVDLTPQRALEQAQKNAKRYFEHPEFADLARDQYGSVQELAASLADSYLQPGAPDLIEIAG